MKASRLPRLFFLMAGLAMGIAVTLGAVYLAEPGQAAVGAALDKPSGRPPQGAPPAFTRVSSQFSPPEALAPAEWDRGAIYTGGMQVQYAGGLYRAKWWTQGETPSRTGETVWAYLGEAPAASAPDEPTPAPVPSKPDDPSAFKVVAYYPSWKEAGLSTLRFDTVTHVNYAFAIPTAEGGLRPLDNPDLAARIISRAHENGAKALLAVGGWSYQDTPLEATFRAATDSDAKLRAFADAILAMCDQYGFDGVDMDWEHPRVDDASKGQYEKLMLLLSEQLHAKGKLLTCAVLSGATPDGGVYYDAAAHSDAVLQAVDWVNVMAYDGGDGERHSPYDFAVASAEYWRDTRKTPAGKVVLGLPFYARPSWASYAELLAQAPDASQKDHCIYQGMDAHYNGVDTIAKKTGYALDSLGGVMIWEITQDTADREKSLLTAIGRAIADHS